MSNHGGADEDDTQTQDGRSGGLTRRRALQTGAVVAAGAWVAPAIVSLDAASAATTDPTGNGSVTGTVFGCQGGPVGEGFTVFLVPNGGGTPLSTTTAKNGSFSFSNVPAGGYSLGQNPNGSNGTPINVPSGGTVNQNFEQLC